ncbi:MAG: hypothetical protein QG586_383 [Pseudomonadota bacterium]|nr:hypothetical protein [Pseudomonadota bacterium]
MPAYKFRAEGFAETMRLAGLTLRSDATADQLKALDAEMKTNEETPLWICGAGEPEHVCSCGFVSDLLCDYPMGDGKTCDLPLCSTCAKQIGEDKHLCEIHWHEWKGKAQVDRIRPIGPHLVK